MAVCFTCSYTTQPWVPLVVTVKAGRLLGLVNWVVLTCTIVDTKGVWSGWSPGWDADKEWRCTKQRTPHTMTSPQCRQFCEGVSFARGDFEKLQRRNNSVQRENGKDEISEKELCREDLWWPCCPTRELLNVCGCWMSAEAECLWKLTRCWNSVEVKSVNVEIQWHSNICGNWLWTLSVDVDCAAWVSVDRMWTLNVCGSWLRMLNVQL